MSEETTDKGKKQAAQYVPPEGSGRSKGGSFTWRPKRKRYPSWIDLLAVVGFFLVGALIGGVVSKLLTQKLGVPKEAGTFVCYVIQLLITIAFAISQKSIRSSERPLLNVKGTGTPWTVLWGTVLLFAVSMVIEPLISLFPASHFEFLQKMLGTGGWVVMTSVIAAPLLEEILFRGIIQDGAMRKFGPAGGIVIASAIFGVVHFIPPQVVNAFFLGLVLGLVYYKTRSLVSVVLIHAFNNAIAYILMVLADGKILSFREMLHNDRTYFIVYAVSAACTVGGGIYAVRVLRRKKKEIQV